MNIISLANESIGFRVGTQYALRIRTSPSVDPKTYTGRALAQSSYCKVQQYITDDQGNTWIAFYDNDPTTLYYVAEVYNGICYGTLDKPAIIHTDEIVLTLPIPYISQRTKPETMYNDCGEASLLMLINAYGMPHTLADMYRTHPRGDTGLSVQSLYNLAKVYGIDLVRKDRSTAAGIYTLADAVDKNQPVIVLIDYGPLQDAGLVETPIRGTTPNDRGHFAVVVGYGHNEGMVTDIVLHDPYWWDDGGKDRIIPVSVFAKAWYQPYTQYNNIGLYAPSVEEFALDQDRLVERTYTVKSGDTLSGVAYLFYGSYGQWALDKIIQKNKLTYPYRLRTGQLLYIP